MKAYGLFCIVDDFVELVLSIVYSLSKHNRAGLWRGCLCSIVYWIRSYTWNVGTKLKFSDPIQIRCVSLRFMFKKGNFLYFEYKVRCKCGDIVGN
jgi:hypothetical protein